jgi:uncharacterized iron-regulated membrane protein
MPGAHAIQVAFPQNPREAVSVRMKEAHDWHRVGLSYVYFEPDGTVLRADRFRELPLGARLIRLMSPLHFGRFGEVLGLGYWPVWVFLTLYLLVGLAPPLLLVTGVLMYWNRDLSKRWSRRLAPARSGATAENVPVA